MRGLGYFFSSVLLDNSGPVDDDDDDDDDVDDEDDEDEEKDRDKSCFRLDESSDAMLRFAFMLMI
jgi:hypothetical protein